MWQRTRVREGEIGCLFDEIQNLVEPIERRYMGEQHCGERRHRASNTVASANTWKCWLGCERSRDCAVKQCRQVRERSRKAQRAVSAGPQRRQTTTRSVVERLQGRDACVARVTRDGPPGLARSKESEAQCPERRRGVRREAPNNPKRSGRARVPATGCPIATTLWHVIARQSC
jgi:hypothetical protein